MLFRQIVTRRLEVVQNELALHELFRAVPLGFKQRKLPFGTMRILKASLPALGQTLLLGSLFLQIALAQTPPLPSPWAPMGPTDATVLSLRRIRSTRECCS